jgi:hypothetical protein
MTPRTHQFDLDESEVEVLFEALEALEYWQAGERLPRHEGMVWIPGDSIDEVDRFWDDRTPTAAEQVAIEDVRAVRDLERRLRA